MSGINYRFNEWRQSGEKAEKWSYMATRLVSKNSEIDRVNGYTIGQVLYLHHIKGMTALEIRKSPIGLGISLDLIKSMIKGFGVQASAEAKEAFDIAMYMVECEPESLAVIYGE